MEVWNSAGSCMSTVKQSFANYSEKTQLKQPWLPPGFRFHPTDEELVTFYLANKILNPNFCDRAIAEADLNRSEPWDLPGQAKMGEKEWYFYSARDRKYPTGMRTNRATCAGYWKATGKDREVVSSQRGELVGMKKTLVFYRGRAPKGVKTNWVMHEYRAEVDLIASVMPHILSKTSKDEWVVCRVFHKSAGGKKMPLAEIKQSNVLISDDSAQDDNADVLKLGSTLPGLMELPLAGSYKDSSWQLPDKPSHSWTPPAYTLTSGAGAAAPTTMSHLTNLLNSLPHPAQAGKFSLFSSHAQPELHDNMNFGVRTFDKTYSFSMDNVNVGGVDSNGVVVGSVDTTGLNTTVQDVDGAGNRHTNILEVFGENVSVRSGAHNNAVLQRATAAADTSVCTFEEGRFPLSAMARGSDQRRCGGGDNREVFERYIQGSGGGSGGLCEAVSYKEGRKAEEYKCSISKGSSLQDYGYASCASGGGACVQGLYKEVCNVSQMQAPAMASLEKYSSSTSSRGFKSPSHELSPAQAALSSDYSSSTHTHLYAPPLYHFPSSSSDLDTLYWVSS